MSYIADNPSLKIYLQDRQQQHTKFTYKCIMYMWYSALCMTSPLLYLHTIKDKYIAIYNEFISQLQIYAKAVRILA